MNERDLSEKLDQLITKIESGSYNLIEIVEELKKLSAQAYAPGNGLSWDAVKPPKAKPQGGFISKTGRKLPF